MCFSVEDVKNARDIVLETSNTHHRLVDVENDGWAKR